ncbi:cyclic nucleotide-binding-like protein, partial [Baffinella frigidus]
MAKCRWLRSLSEEEADEMLRYVVVQRVPANSVLLREGDPGDFLFAIAEGEGDPGDFLFAIAEGEVLDPPPVEVYCAEQWVAWSGEGSVVGEMAMLYGVPRQATVVASSVCVVLILHLDTLQFVLDASPAP